MGEFASLIEKCFDFLTQEFEIYGHSVSFFGVFLLTAIIGIVFRFVRQLFD